mmetsp:Transcript_22700/g.42676  ORF Transcript_22700/g.42676 Transcript_22700/m.42676 type:complete len:200 (-) Transcript_22700:48-647(-)
MLLRRGTLGGGNRTGVDMQEASGLLPAREQQGQHDAHNLRLPRSVPARDGRVQEYRGLQAGHRGEAHIGGPQLADPAVSQHTWTAGDRHEAKLPPALFRAPGRRRADEDRPQGSFSLGQDNQDHKGRGHIVERPRGRRQVPQGVRAGLLQRDISRRGRGRKAAAGTIAGGVPGRLAHERPGREVPHHGDDFLEFFSVNL